MKMCRWSLWSCSMTRFTSSIGFMSRAGASMVKNSCFPRNSLTIRQSECSGTASAVNQACSFPGMRSFSIHAETCALMSSNERMRRTTGLSAFAAFFSSSSSLRTSGFLEAWNLPPARGLPILLPILFCSVRRGKRLFCLYIFKSVLISLYYKSRINPGAFAGERLGEFAERTVNLVHVQAAFHR